MEARFRSWWQNIRKPLDAVIMTLLVVLVILVVVVILGYILHWNWTGLSKKTLWDWLQLLIIPTVLAVGGYLFNLMTRRNEQKITEQRYQNDQKIALDKQREDLLQAYLDRVAELLLEKDLHASEPSRNVVRARTLTVLYRLDAHRKESLLQFLSESGLISVIDLSGAQLAEIHLSETNLAKAKLSGADLSKAELYMVNLTEANLSHANLSEARLYMVELPKANLRETSLVKAFLQGVNLKGADLAGADLQEADLALARLNGALLFGSILDKARLWTAQLENALLEGAFLKEANLTNANLKAANLSMANLGKADLTKADLSAADLSGANLSGAFGTTPEQLKQAKSLKGATMPDGSKHP